MEKYLTKYGMEPGGENDLLHLAIYLELVNSNHISEGIIENSIVDSVLCYPPKTDEGWSHDNQLGYAALKNRFYLENLKSNATITQKASYFLFNFPMLWVLLGIITCLRGKETLYDGRKFIRTSGLRLLWLRCRIRKADKTQKFFQFLLKRFHPARSFGRAFEIYYKDPNHPISKQSHLANI